MNTPDQDAISEQLEKARAVVATLNLPPEVTSIDLKSGPDAGGEPALWLFVQVKHDVVGDREQVKFLTQFARDVQGRLIESGITLFPYTSLEQAA